MPNGRWWKRPFSLLSPVDDFLRFPTNSTTSTVLLLHKIWRLEDEWKPCGASTRVSSLEPVSQKAAMFSAKRAPTPSSRKTVALLQITNSQLV